MENHRRIMKHRFWWVGLQAFCRLDVSEILQGRALPVPDPLSGVKPAAQTHSQLI